MRESRFPESYEDVELKVQLPEQLLKSQQLAKKQEQAGRQASHACHSGGGGGFGKGGSLIDATQGSCLPGSMYQCQELRGEIRVVLA